MKGSDRQERQGGVALPDRLHHIAVGLAHKSKRVIILVDVIMLVDGLNFRLASADVELLRQLTPDTTRDYQLPRSSQRCPEHTATMRRHITIGGRWGIEPLTSSASSK